LRDGYRKPSPFRVNLTDDQAEAYAMATVVCDHGRVTYDRTKLRQLGEERRAALAALARIRREVAGELPAARKALTWREISAAATYTEQQLRAMMLPSAERAQREEQRRRRRRKETQP
jgi:hypothetical protein